MITKKDLNKLVKSGNVQDVILAHELNLKEKMEKMNIDREVEYLTPNQKEAAKEYAENLLKRGIKKFYGLEDRTSNLVHCLSDTLYKKYFVIEGNANNYPF